MKVISLYSILLYVLPTLKADVASQAIRTNETGRALESRKPFELIENRIVGGQLASETNKSWPFFVHLGQCGGSLVAPDVVLTAAHCNYTIGNEVLVGAVDYWNPKIGDAEWRIVTKKVSHPKYDELDNDRDILLIKIQPVTKPHLKPIKLNPTSSVPPTKGKGSILTVIGTGATNIQGAEYENYLRWTTVNTVPHADCDDRYGGYINKESMLCAWAPGRDSCLGDSGGPLLNPAGVQVGLVSFGVGCANTYWPAVYSRISGEIGWIQKTICELSDAKPQWCPSANTSIVYTGKSLFSYTVNINYRKFPTQIIWYIQEVSSKKKLFRKGRQKWKKAKFVKRLALKPLQAYDLVMIHPNRKSFKVGTYGLAIKAKRVGKARVLWDKKVMGDFQATKRLGFIVPSLY